MGKLIPIIIFVIIVINILRRLAEYNRSRPNTEGDGTEWTGDTSGPGSAPTPPRPRPTPSERVREILEQLAQGDSAPLPPAHPPLPPPPASRPVVAAPTPPPLPMARPTSAAPSGRRYLAEDSVPGPAAAAAPEDADAPRLAAADAAYRETLRKAFPPAMAMVRGTRAQGRLPFAVRLRGRHSLRQAIVLTEVLGPPRAFDV